MVGVERQRPKDGPALRVSLLTQCQFDCAYCRPGAAVSAGARSGWLSTAHYHRLARLLGAIGVRKVRFTGGEPLLRPDVVDIIRAFHDAMPGTPLALTTNGARLAALLEPLAEAGLSRATVHVDSLRPERYVALMGHAPLQRVLDSVLAAKQRLHTVKLNVVVQRGRNDDELLDFLEWSRVTGIEVRFIELMNTGSAVAYTRQVLMTGAEILERITTEAPVTALGRREPTDPATLYRAGGVTFGVIASDSAPFCEACDRLRLSADGVLRGCLYSADGAPLGELLRAGATDQTLVGELHRAWRGKRSLRTDFSSRASFSMAQTGG